MPKGLLFALAWIAVFFAIDLGIYLLLIDPNAPRWKPILSTGSIAFAAAGVLLSLAAFLYAQGRDKGETDEKRSLFYLESASKAYEEAKELLADGNNDRATWIAAARALAHANTLSKNVTLKAHRIVLDLNQMKYRWLLHGYLANKQSFFFYGAKTSCSLEEAAAASTAPEERNGRTILSTARMLSVESLRVIWEAASWPDQYDDPLPTKGFSNGERFKTMVLFPGLHDFLEYDATHYSVGGKVEERKEAEKSNLSARNQSLGRTRGAITRFRRWLQNSNR